MPEYTASYEDTLKRWSALCGNQFSDLLTTETDLFKEYANYRLRYIWNYTQWPETTGFKEVILIDRTFEADTDMMHILGVYEEDPFSTNNKAFRTYRVRRQGSDVYVYGPSVPDVVWVYYKKRHPSFSSNTDTIPMRFQEFVARGAYADWLRAEADPNADRQEAQVDSLLNRELDIFERQEGASTWYNGPSPYTPPNYY